MKIDNQGDVSTQVNVDTNTGTINLINKTRLHARFAKLNSEVTSDARYEDTIEELRLYLTAKDGIDMPTKLKDGGFEKNDIHEATISKDKFARKMQKYRFYESAQIINSELFAKIKMDFNTFVLPLIKQEATKDKIMEQVVTKVINPVLSLINNDGEKDEYLNYNADDIFGMIYYLTGQCHLNWRNYDAL